MSVVNYGYFLFGIFIFCSWRLFHHINYFKRTPTPVPGKSSVTFFTFGAIYFLVLINLFQNIDLTYGYDCLTLLPSVLIILGLINFWGESFIAPTKNYLFALGLGVLIGTASLGISYFAFLNAGIPFISGFLELIPYLLGLIIGVIAGKLIYVFFLKRRYPNWNTPLWQINNLWRIINHTAFLFSLLILAVLEGLLQMESNSLIYLFISF
ncbi:MAG: hypothetical protein ACTSYB_09730 [Candidatus Helarchaeota archaeon]